MGRDRMVEAGNSDNWYEMVWYGLVWYWYGMVGDGMVWHGMVWYDMVWYGLVWYGMVWYGMVWYGKVYITGSTFRLVRDIIRKISFCQKCGMSDGMDPFRFISGFFSINFYLL